MTEKKSSLFGGPSKLEPQDDPSAFAPKKEPISMFGKIQEPPVIQQAKPVAPI
jgi:hypothetical protein